MSLSLLLSLKKKIQGFASDGMYIKISFKYIFLSINAMLECYSGRERVERKKKNIPAIPKPDAIIRVNFQIRSVNEADVCT